MDFPNFILAQLAAYDGSVGIRDTDEHTGLSLHSFLCTEDTAFTAFEVNDADATAEYGVGAGHKANDLIVVKHTDVITKIELASGGGRGYIRVVDTQRQSS